MALNPGARLGRYEIVAVLGRGGMGEVFRARDTQLHRELALKVLPRDFVADPDRRARFQREAELLAALNHPNIAAIYGFEEGPSEGERTLVLELVEGPTLANISSQRVRYRTRKCGRSPSRSPTRWNSLMPTASSTGI